MIGKIIPVVLALLGLGAGMGAGLVLKPKESEPANEAVCGPTDDHGGSVQGSFADLRPKDQPVEEQDESLFDYIKLNNQFIVPVLKDGNVSSMVVVTISLEVEPESKDDVYLREPKLRDAFLGVLFDHANIGAFDGNFTASRRLATLRRGLLNAAQSVVGERVTDVLLTDINRQDM